MSSSYEDLAKLGYINQSIAQAGQSVSMALGSDRDMKKAVKYQKEMLDYSHDKNQEQALFNQKLAREDWNMQNEYNKPSAQMARYAEAGLNPDLIYSQSNANMNAPAQSTAQGSSTPDAGSLMNAANNSQSLRLQSMANVAAIEESKSRIALNNAQADQLNVDTKFNEQTFDQRVLGVGLSNSALDATIDQIEANTDLSKTQKESLKYHIQETKNNLSRFKLDVAEQVQRISNMSEEQRLMQYEQILKSKLIDKAAQEIVNLAKEAKLTDQNILNQRYVREQLQAVTYELYSRGKLNNATMHRLHEILPFEKLSILSGSALDVETLRLMDRNTYWQNVNGTINAVSSLLTGGAMMYATRGRSRGRSRR